MYTISDDHKVKVICGCYVVEVWSLTDKRRELNSVVP